MSTTTDAYPVVKAALTQNPGATAKEIGVRSVDMTLLERDGKVKRVGKVETGGRGRPAIKWDLSGV